MADKMRIIIEKSGGSSLNSAEGNRQAALRIVKTLREEVEPTGSAFLVVSARGKTEKTPKITDLAYEVLNGTNKTQAWGRLEKVLRDEVKEHKFSQNLIEDLIIDVRKFLDSDTIDSYSEPRIAGLGERTKVRILNKLIRSEIGQDNCVMLDYGDIGIIGNDTINRCIDVPINHQKTLREIEKVLANRDFKGKVIVVPGFMGIDKTTRMITLQRNASDDTATYIGAALDADEIRIFSDKDGIHTVHPEILPQAKPITELTYREAEAFSGLGAEIINYTAIRPAKDRAIPIRMLNTYNPEHSGTYIGSAVKPAEQDYGIRAVAHVPGYALLTVTGMTMNERGISAKVSRIFSECGFSIDGELDGDSCRRYAIKLEEGDTGKLLTMLSIGGHSVEDMNTGMARLTLVGQGLMHEKNGENAERKMTDTLAEKGIQYEILSSVTKSVIRTAFVPHDKTILAVKSIYKNFGFAN